MLTPERADPAASRRRFLAVGLGSLSGLLLDPLPAIAAAATSARRIGTASFVGEGRPRFGVLLGEGLDGRRIFDLSSLEPDGLAVPPSSFFVRTRRPPSVTAAAEASWTVRLEGRVAAPQAIGIETLRAAASDRGEHLLECSGNGRHRRYGLMSAARWRGVSLGDLLDEARPEGGATHVLVEGADDHPAPSRRSVPGASWVFPRSELDGAGAFLATEMNEGALPADNGAPVRLVVPGWYGCCCIKWVRRVELVGEDAPATSQMKEFAGRTHQERAFERARDYRPATIDLGALPIRVEKWLVDGRIVYRVLGILWGGTARPRELLVRFGEGPERPVDAFSRPRTTTWSLWSHEWRPPAPGRYAIRLRVGDPGIRTRRLDRGDFARTVAIDEV